MNAAQYLSIGADEAVRLAPVSLHALPHINALTPAQILRREHARRPLGCDEGPVRQDFAALQTTAAARGPRI